MTYKDGEYVAWTKRDETHPPNKKEKDVSHRRFNVTLHPVQLYESVKKSIHNDELDYERMLTLFRVLADALNRENEESNVIMWQHIKTRTERWFVNNRKQANKKLKSK